MPADLQNARELFLHAVGKLPAEQWEGYVAEACAGNAELAQQVGHLLKVHREAGSFLDRPAEAVGLTGAFTPEPGSEAAAVGFQERTGTFIGPYKLLQQIGEGGMGSVWMAEQTQPVQRKVALKLIKAGMDSSQVIARFEAERQALALMDHPNIARVLDAGTTEGGRPYFVMELVKGVPITRYCDEHHLTPRERLELFVPVCQAVQHAHQKGIIHRDLKPSNVMVCLYDGQPAPKVIDFGIAKATGARLTEKTLFTEIGSVVGTLEYMSPEQAELNQLDIDTRSDIYSLGVLLYELLTGTTPLERKRFKEVAFLEVLRLIREEESPRPSTRLSTTEGLPSIAANRSLEPKKLSGVMRGELDWIVMKALEKDRSRRYETANGFAMDMQRYLTDEPVQAGPPSARYRLKKFLLRNRGSVMAASLVLLALVGGIIGTTLGLLQARASQEQAQDDAWQASQERDAARKAEEAESVQRRLAETALKREKKALELERGIVCSLRILQAYEEGRFGNVARADQLLNACPPDLRHWEWDYVSRLCHGEGSTLQLAVKPGFRIAAVSLDGQRVAVGPAGMVRIFDTATGKVTQPIPARDHTVEDMIFSPDGKWLATFGHDRPAPVVHVWDVGTGNEVAVLRGTGELSMCGAAFRPDGRQLAAADCKGDLYVWDLPGGAQRLRFVPHPVLEKKRTMSVAFSPDGARLVTACPADTVVKLWNAADGKLVRSFEKGPGFARVLFSPLGTWVAAVDNDRAIRLYDVRTSQTRHVLRSNRPGWPPALAFSPDEAHLVAVWGDTAVLWHVQSGQEVRVYRGAKPGKNAAIDVAFSADGKRITAVGWDGILETWAVRTGPEVLKLDIRLANGVAFSPDGKLLAAAGTGVRIWDGATGQRLYRFDNDFDTAMRVAFSPDGVYLAAGLHSEVGVSVRVWNTRTGKLVQTLSGAVPGKAPGVPTYSIAFSPDGKWLASGGQDRVVRVWDLAAGKELFHLDGHRRTVTGLVFSQDGKRLVAASGGIVSSGRDGAGENDPLYLPIDKVTDVPDLKIWDLATRKELLSLSLPGKLAGLALSRDEALVAVPFGDKSVRLYNTATGEEVRVLRGHDRPPWAVAFSPDGRRLVSGGRGDQMLKLWDVKTGQEIPLPGRAPQHVVSLAFPADGRKIVAACNDGLWVWDATPSK